MLPQGFFLDNIQLSPRRLARATDPSTSHAAAIRAGLFAESHEGRIYNALKLHGEATADRLSRIIGLTSVQISRRTPAMCERGLIEVARTEDGSDVVLDGFRVWRACA